MENISYFGKGYDEKVIKLLIGERRENGHLKTDLRYPDQVIPIMKSDWFGNSSAKIIFDIIKSFYNKDRSIPASETIKAIVKAKYPRENQEAKKRELITFLNNLDEMFVPDEEWIKRNTLNFINHKRLQEFVDYAQYVILNAKVDEFQNVVEKARQSVLVDVSEKRIEMWTPNDNSDLDSQKRKPIPTTIPELDKIMNGGLALSELGLIIAPLKGGKAQPYHAQVLTTTGYKSMGSLVFGEKIVDSKGNTQTIIGIYPQGNKDYYTITLMDGSKTWACLEHLWEIKDTEGTRVINTKEIVDNGCYNYQLPKFVNNTKHWVQIKSIEFCANAPCRCIRVSSPDSLYITDDNIITHNTTFASYIANGAARAGYNVLQVYFEDTTNQIKAKHRSKFSGLNLSIVSNPSERNLKSIKRATDKGLKSAYDNKGSLILHKMSSTNTTVEKIRRVVETIETVGAYRHDLKIYEKRKIDLLLIDYVDCIKPQGKYQKGWEGQGEIMREIENIISYEELNIACWAFTQGGRSSLNSEMVDVADMGGDLKKAQIGHFIMSFAKTNDQRASGKANVAILGSRLGRDGIVFRNCIFDNGNMTIDFGSEAQITEATSATDGDGTSFIDDDDNPFEPE